jgi:perosamine synthetase
MKIPITKPFFGKEEAEAVTRVLESGWVVQGSKVAEFEKMVSGFTGAKFALASTSCTTALHLALLAAGIGPGDEVLVPSFSFIASANTIEYTGAKPLFIDIDLKTFNIDHHKAEEYLCKAKKRGSRVKGIMPVHLFGLTADMSPIMQLASVYELKVIEDAACALGSLYQSKAAGTFGNAGCFSFHPRKPVSTGEGGMITTDDTEVAMKIRSLRDHGAAVSDFTREGKGGFLLSAYEMLGYNYRMTDIQGAIGVEQMKKFPWILEKKISRAKIYDNELERIPWLKTPMVPDDCKHTYQSYVTLISYPDDQNLIPTKIEELNRRRNKIMSNLEEKGVATRQGTHAIHSLNYYKNKYGLKDMDYPNSFAADKLSMTIPLYPQMTDVEQEYVIQQIKAQSSIFTV